MSNGGLTCVITIHGIGFQKAPDDEKGIAGYADELHGNLKRSLKEALGEDPERPHGGAVYVSSEYPPQTRDIEEGLKRIGQWKADGTVTTDRPLTREGASIAHVALVYSGDEEHVADPLAGTVLALLGAGGMTGYASPIGLLRIFGDSLDGLLHHQTPAPRPAETEAAAAAGSNAVTALVDHVGGYVARNKLRERVRMFVRDAINRLAARPDVKNIVINSHSNGTVIAFDVLPRIWPSQSAKLSLFVTAGCPLRKYMFLMSWGHEIISWPSVRWLNYYDIDDVVADQLQPDHDTQLTGLASMGGPGLFVNYAIDLRPIPVEDRQISNVKASKHPHNYWADPIFCESLAQEIGKIAEITM